MTLRDSGGSALSPPLQAGCDSSCKRQSCGWDSTLPGPLLPWAHYTGTLCRLGARVSCWACLHPAVYGDAAYGLTPAV